MSQPLPRLRHVPTGRNGRGAQEWSRDENAGGGRVSARPLTAPSTVAVPYPNSERTGNEVGNFTPAHLGSFQPALTLDGFDDKIISLYARGMTVREIQGHLRELYAVEVSPDLISRVTDAVLDEVRDWQNRPLDTVYPVVFFDALAGQDPRRERGQEQGRLPGAGAGLRGPQARPGPVDRAERGRQVLAAGHERAQEPRRR